MAPGGHTDSAVVYDAAERQWLLFQDPIRIHVAANLESVVRVFRTVEHEVAVNGLYAAGFVAYEAGPALDSALAARPDGIFPLLWFGIYRKPEKIFFPSLSQGDQITIPWEPSVSENEYRHSFRRIKEYIRAGDTYQVNYSFRLRGPFSGDPWKLFVRMVHAQHHGYGGFVNIDSWAVCSASPELFFALEPGNLVSRPMKGTASRGRWHAEDLRQAAWLANSEKNRAENVMIVDMVRNDMGRICTNSNVTVPGLFDVEQYPTLWQMTSTVACKTRANITDTFAALFPAASITGAPKVRTTAIIAELENAPRRIYTGSVGFLSPGGRAQFNVAIRTVLVDKTSGEAEYGVGGGIVWDSENNDELQECYTKAQVLVEQQPDFALLETILWTPANGYFLLDRHLARLADSAVYFSRSVDLAPIRSELNGLARDLPSRPFRIRVLLSKDRKPLFEACPVEPLPDPYRLRLAQGPINSRDPFLCNKTTNRTVYEQAMAASHDNDDVLLWNEREEVTESCVANVVVEMDSKLLTPPVQSGLLAGTYRAYLLDQHRIVEEIIKVQDLGRCSRIFLINSVRGMWEVSLSF